MSQAVITVLPPLRWASLALNLTVTLLAAWASFGFGLALGGALIGVVAAVNGALMASLLTSALVDWIGAAWRRAATRVGGRNGR